MKRNEEIVKQAVKEQSQLYQQPEWRAGFISGAEWADKTMLDRACEWLKDIHNIEKHLGILTSRTEDLSKAFRQAMEGGME